MVCVISQQNNVYYNEKVTHKVHLTWSSIYNNTYINKTKV